MKPGAFAYRRPASLDEALALLAAHGDAAKPIAGGQSLVPMMNLRVAQPELLVDVAGLPGLDGILDLGDAVEVGALARHQSIADAPLVRARCPLLAEAAACIGHYAIRQRGTLGGSLAHADPAAQLPLVAVTLDATIVVQGPGGRREVPAGEFFVSIMTTTLAADELIVAARFPASGPGSGAAFRLFNRRHGDYAIVSAATRVVLDAAGAVARLDLGVGAVEAVPVAFAALAATQHGRMPDAAWIDEVAAAARDAVDAQDDSRATALYRRELTGTLVARALAASLEHARTGAARR
ncbi:MAG: FAD binding domain-containing protein [Burkholderiales bacterium]|nr:FAD binding domain-containing protein [Burkholderiales bacterium]